MRFNKLVETRYGPMLVNRHDRYIGRSLSEYGEFSRGEIDLLKALVQPDSVVLDIGANIGAIAIPLARHCGAVLAFEPQAFVFQLLCANIALNSLINVHPFLAAITTQAGQIQVPKLDPRMPNNFGGLNLFVDAPQKTTVVSMRIDDLSIPSCALIKCDVEGMEEIALKSGQRVLAEFRPALYVENDRPDNEADLIAFLRAGKRRLFSHLPRLVEEENFAGNPSNIFGDEVLVSCNVLAWPEERPLPIDLETYGLHEITEAELASHQRANECEPVP